PPGSPPRWFTPARDNLLGADLGEDWLDCVNLWIQLEERLGYGSGPLPAVAFRPEEWSRFLAKNAGKARNYDTQPVIKDSAEFGITFLKWWHNMQPKERRSPEDRLLPLPIYDLPDSSWEHLLRAGSSGSIAILMQAMWW
ncbi:hypothetical protein BDN70DRAFT_763143, partial [Pholiota conissans]